jgi:hypothetical protein
VSVEVAALVLAVHRNVRAVDIKHQFLGRLGMAGNELLHQHFVKRSGMLVRSILPQAAERGCRPWRLAAADGRLHHQIVAQPVVVAHVRPAGQRP